MSSKSNQPPSQQSSGGILTLAVLGFRNVRHLGSACTTYYVLEYDQQQFNSQPSLEHASQSFKFDVPDVKHPSHITLWVYKGESEVVVVSLP